MATSTINISRTSGLTPNQYEAFSKAVRYILTEWPSLNFAMENGMGGSEAREKHAWMIDHVISCMNAGMDIDLDEYLGEMINQEFDTIIDDGSLEYNTKWINKFYKDCQQGKEMEVLDAINSAAAKKQSLGNMRIPNPVEFKLDEQDKSDNTSDEEDDDDDMQT